MVSYPSIRPIQDHEIYVLAEIIRLSFRDVAERFNLTPENCPKHPSNYFPERVQSDLERGATYFLLCEDEIPVGTVAIEQPNPETCYLERLAVLPTHRKKGYGEALVFHVFQEAKKRTIKNIGIAIIAEQDELRAWYEKLGFRFTSRKRFEHLPFEVMFLNYAIID